VRRHKRLRSVSKKRAAGVAAYTAFVLGLKDLVGQRCEFCYVSGPLDPHHTRKPRSRYLMDTDSVVILCRRHHDMTEGPFKYGRVVVQGTRSSGWQMRVVFARDKFAVRDGTARGDDGVLGSATTGHARQGGTLS